MLANRRRRFVADVVNNNRWGWRWVARLLRSRKIRSFAFYCLPMRYCVPRDVVLHCAKGSTFPIHVENYEPCVLVVAYSRKLPCRGFEALKPDLKDSNTRQTQIIS
jgi:hypothetical protein